jgi:large subunit ribosomal protein L21e
MSSTERKFSNNLDVSLQVSNRVIRKRIHMRVEHVQPSRCIEDYRLRKLKNNELKVAEKAKGQVISTKRQPKGPKPCFMVEAGRCNIGDYDIVNDLKGGY